MAIQAIDVIDTAIKIGLGALVGGMFAYFLERIRYKNERDKERLRLRQEAIITPVVTFIDDLLIPMSEAYWSHLDGVQSNVEQRIVALRNKETMIAARVAALGNEELTKSFSALTHQLFNVRSQLDGGKIGLARDEMKSATELAGKVLALLFDLERR